MGKKSGQSPMKISKYEKKQNLNGLIKILRPKVYITDSSNFKNLVQELTGNGKIYSPVLSSPPSSISASLSPPIWEVPFLESSADHDHTYRENYSLDSSCFSTPLEGSPDISPPGSLNYALESSLSSQKMEFSPDYKELESMLMDMDSSYDVCYEMLEQEVCAYDYDLSSLI
ncbi:hypothetical protein CDL12_15819 [Handroanthus impetiginosus]|uniref:VQ domain-containing protein n=1 Tax=Handroanthus impetiginosus TaxID=429701 RepID=A0A2G9H232_9LAMI|nr:hypothetical protein CDL12_15819 [Handroanthus impetiginosus]